MPRMRKVLAALFLSLTLATTPVFAGDILIGITSDSPQPSSSQIAPTGTDAQNSASGAQASTAVDPVSEIVLSLLQSVLSVF